MSAFMVSNGTMDKVLEGIYTLAAEGYLSPLRLEDKTYDPKDFDSLTILGNDLFAMNAEAINHRYEAAGAFEEYEFSFQFRPTVHVRCYKALQCLIYQCSEGDVPDTELYKLMERVSSAMASRIIREHSAYEDAPWDSPHRANKLRKVIRVA